VDAVAVAMITPGPVVITTGFIGYLVAGFWGAVVAALATFLPCYLFTVLPPLLQEVRQAAAIIAFVDGVTAAAIGAITGAVIVIGERSITDWVTALLALTTAAVLWKFKKLPARDRLGCGLDRTGGLPVDARSLVGFFVYTAFAKLACSGLAHVWQRDRPPPDWT
jgi:hypothetical protein